MKEGIKLNQVHKHTAYNHLLTKESASLKHNFQNDIFVKIINS